MRTEIAALVIILGCFLTQTESKNYCNTNGTFCALCVRSAGDQSCSVCGKMGFSTRVKDVAGTYECAASTATNCMASNPTGIDKCGMCNTGFVLDTATFTCFAETTFKLPANCTSLMKTGTTVTCQGCINGFALSKDKLTCKAPITTENCLSAMIGADDKEICIGCKSGFAFKGVAGKDCATLVPAAVTGCARLSDDGVTCLNQCNIVAGFWMSDVNKCSKQGGSGEIILKFKRAYPNYSSEQISNAENIYQEFMNVGLTLDSQIAYGLATAVVESNVIPAIEHRAAVGTELRKEQDEYWYTGFYGRGYVQLKLNYTYQQFSTLLKTDYYNNPDLALNPLQAARIMAYGFKNGSFTGQQLELFVNQSHSDFMGARRVLELKLKDASDYAQAVEKILNAQNSTPIKRTKFS